MATKKRKRLDGTPFTPEVIRLLGASGAGHTLRGLVADGVLTREKLVDIVGAWGKHKPLGELYRRLSCPTYENLLYTAVYPPDVAVTPADHALAVFLGASHGFVVDPASYDEDASLGKQLFLLESGLPDGSPGAAAYLVALCVLVDAVVAESGTCNHFGIEAEFLHALCDTHVGPGVLPRVWEALPAALLWDVTRLFGAVTTFVCLGELGVRERGWVSFASAIAPAIKQAFAVWAARWAARPVGELETWEVNLVHAHRKGTTRSCRRRDPGKNSSRTRTGSCRSSRRPATRGGPPP